MKLRYGFVSNSSSSSFTCDCCGETQSGMDMSRRDAGMIKCLNGHTFCESHAMTPTLSVEEKREALIKMNMENKWRSEEDKAKNIAEIRTWEPGIVEDFFDEYNDDESIPQFCPICQMEQVCDSDVVRYALIKLGVKTTKDLAKFVKMQYGTYDAFQKYLKENL